MEIEHFMASTPTPSPIFFKEIKLRCPLFTFVRPNSCLLVLLMVGVEVVVVLKCKCVMQFHMFPSVLQQGIFVVH